MKLLVVEDEEKIARSLEKGLSAEGYVVDVATDGDSANTMLQAGSYDLVLLDWMIPGTYDGPALIKRWRENKLHLPILMLSAKSAIGNRVQGLDVGADDYLPKPFSYDELLARIRSLLRRPQPPVNNVLQTNNLDLNTVAKTIIYKARPVKATAKEFQLLEYLLRHKGEVISKDQLLDHVWSDEARVQHNTVETFIANLRKKVGPSEAVIKTMRGYGYKID
ncbi:MAG: response regulator transcription factor [Candidatus Saccharimonadales bacterium]